MATEPDPDLETTTTAPLADDPTLVAGRYRIERTLGRGGGGIVWLARDENLGREVALKKVSGETDTEILLTRGMREARTSAALAHDHVVRVYDAFEHEGSPWIVMEYVPGPSLADLIDGGTVLPPERVATIGAQVATALAAAHGAGVLHRDVKPGNVLLTDETGTHAKLTDFGIARAEGDHQLTRTGLVSGTAAYFSPEMAQGEDPTQASDVWALGATLYAAVEGRRPFPDAPNAVAQLHTIVREAPAEPRLAGPLTPVLAGMLHGDPQQRWSAERAAAALRTIAGGGETAEGRRGAGPAGTPPTWADAAGTGAAGAAAAGVAAGAAGWADAGTDTQQHHPVGTTRQVPVVEGSHARAARPGRARPTVAPPRGPARSRPRWGTIAVWLLALPLAALLGWLVWTIATTGDGPGDGSGTTSTAPAGDARAVTPEEAGDLARTFYQTLLPPGGLDAARQYLGPDADVDPGISDGLTRVEWDQVTTEPAEDGSVAVGITVRYFYGESVLEQREDLVVARTEPGGSPLIVGRVTGEPAVTEPDSDSDGDSG
ncbi:serine/threonine-protein kinase [Ornithinimicrobium cerasi]|uniref:serine/threonine-protein kinase n=1 Tax=Ornithinimicrobium cerasi TaxID=2248773 RepID=UPI000EFE5AB8|nr:serine/threonine-protein kinase [Ornithinimicrobium cerasi]